MLFSVSILHSKDTVYSINGGGAQKWYFLGPFEKSSSEYKDKIIDHIYKNEAAIVNGAPFYIEELGDTLYWNFEKTNSQ